MLSYTNSVFSQLYAQVLLLKGRRTGLYNYIHTKVGKLSVLLSMWSDGNRESYDN